MWWEVGNSEKRRSWMRPAIRQRKGQRVFFRPLPPTALPSYLSPQEFVDLSNQMYYSKKLCLMLLKVVMSFQLTKRGRNKWNY
ncbi:hypothetical protein D1872_161780 [compost metagenome]